MLDHDVICKEVPEIEADLEKFFVLDAAHLRQVRQTLQRLVPQHLDLVVGLNRVGEVLNKVNVVFEDRRYGDGQLLGESLKTSL